jgi:phosphohistidine phosphatase
MPVRTAVTPTPPRGDYSGDAAPSPGFAGRSTPNPHQARRTCPDDVGWTHVIRSSDVIDRSSPTKQGRQLTPQERTETTEPRSSPVVQRAPTRTLVLLRHGKSAYPPGVDDHQRPLAPRGRREASLAGAWIAGHLPPVDHIICSTAERTRQTLQATGIETPSALVDFTDAIYEAYPDELLELVAAANPADRTLLLIGHAPGLPMLAEELAGPGSNRAALGALSAKFPTSAIAVLAVDGPWSGVSPDTTRLVDFIIPRA